ncbi:MAG: response regulator transcription factor [Tannerellaceae bacterium]|jgi:DNA-binding NarL/FixJ family response regulator|nr:response regulator transcription factor [Tannerellaceae bacterium]
MAQENKQIRVRVHIADSHEMLLEGLAARINASGFASVCGISRTLCECRSALSLQLPDVLILDLKQPDGNGIDLCMEIKNSRSQIRNIKILILTDYKHWVTVRYLLKNLDVSGYVLKTSPLSEVILGIDMIMEEEDKKFYCSKTRRIMRQEMEDEFFFLTVREQLLLRLIADNYTNEEIAERLPPVRKTARKTLSLETVKSYRKILLKKFAVLGTLKTELDKPDDTCRTIEMLKTAMQMGWIWTDIVP